MRLFLQEETYNGSRWEEGRVEKMHRLGLMDVSDDYSRVVAYREITHRDVCLVVEGKAQFSTNPRSS